MTSPALNTTKTQMATHQRHKSGEHRFRYRSAGDRRKSSANRLPSIRALEAMPSSYRHAILDASARDLRNELDALDVGIVVSVDGVPVKQHRRNVKRRLNRAYKTADHFGDFVGQPDDRDRRAICHTLESAVNIRASEFHYAVGFA